MSRASSYLRRISAIDYRTLALFRIGLGLIILADLAIRSAGLEMFHTDAGVLSRSDRILTLGPTWTLSLFDIAGDSVAIAGALFIVYALLAVLLIVGFHTRLATIACWVFACSLRIKMPLVVTAGDNLLIALLLWSAFLPLGARFSLDRVLDRTPKPAEASISNAASFVLLFQVASVFAFTGLSKLGYAHWRGGDGVHLAMTAEFYTTPFAHWVRDQSWLLAPLNYAVLALEILAPILLFWPRRVATIRTAVVVCLILMIIAFAFSLQIGIFPWVTLVGVLLFVPGALWDRCWQKRPVSDEPIPLHMWRSPRHILLGVLFSCMLLGNFCPSPGRGIPLPRAAYVVLSHIGLDQDGWPMFTSIARDHGWFVVPGRMQGGGDVDLYDGSATIDMSRPQLLSSTFPTYRHRKYFMNIKRTGESIHRPLARYYCRWWNQNHSGTERVKHLDILYMREITLLDFGTDPARRVPLLHHVCDSD